MDNEFHESNRPDKESQRYDALKSVRILSKIAVKDAGFVTESPDDEKEVGIRLDRNLYVTRTIEAEIHKLLVTSGADELSFLLIIGEAGFGKTSLLWHLYHTLMENSPREAWFIKSTFLMPSISPTDEQGASHRSSHLTVSKLLAAVEAVKQEGKKPVMLLDTVDLLLHNERDRERLLEALSNLMASGCRVIATSRPQEATHLRAQADHLVGLQEYNDQELEEAVTSHVNCFYERVDAREMAEHLERILNAVSNGLQIREVCTNPLTLRMLFTLYAPEEVPLEINTFQLYRKFWDLRVATDHRAGSSYSSGEDLGKTASMVALSMLVEGTPELTNLLLERRFQEWQGSHRELSMLTSRGILHRSEDGMTRFFHQTFFEHCAARGLLLKFCHKAIPLLHARMKSNPNDLFVSPIMEQTLLLVEDESRQLRSMGNDVLLEMLKSSHQLLKGSGIYVYIHRRDVNNKLENEVGNLLSKGENAIINRFLNLVPNIPHESHRIKTLFSELNIAWERDTMEIHKHILELLERLAGRFPYDVEGFVRAHNILDFSQRQWVLGFKNIINIIAILIKHFSKPKQRELIQKLVQLLRKPGPDALHDRILEALHRIAIFLHSTSMAHECDTALQTLGERANKKKSIPLAKLFYIQWNNANTSIETIIEELKQKKGFSLKARLIALSEYLLNTNQQEASRAWSHFSNETDDYKKWMWAHLLIPKLITGIPDASFEKGKTSPPGTTESVLFFREKINWLFAFWNSHHTTEMQGTKTSTARMDTFQKVRKAVIFANPGKSVFMRLLDCPSLANNSPWLEPDLFGELLADAYNIGHPGASKAMQQLVDKPGEYSKELIACIGSRLKKLKIHNNTVIDTFISFCLKTDDSRLLRILIENNRDTVEEIFPRWNKPIDEYVRQLVVSSSAKKRRRGLYLWKCLMALQPSVTPSLTELVALLQTEVVNSLRGLIMELIGCYTTKTGVGLGEVMTILRPFGSHKDENLRNSAIIAMSTAISNSGEDPSSYIEQLFDIIQAPPVKVKQVCHFGWVLAGLVPEKSKLAAEILGRLLLVCEEQLKCNPKRDLHCYLRQPIRRILHFSPVSSYDTLLQLVPKLEWPLGALIVEAVCFETFNQMAPRLDQLLEHPDIPGKVKEKIRRHKYNRERTLGGEGWPELEELLSSGFIDTAAKDHAQVVVKKESSKKDQPDPDRENKSEGKKKILFLSANQAGDGRLSIDREFRAIDVTVGNSRYRHRLELIPKFAVSYEDFRQALLHHEPQIVHFSGHGSEDGLVVLDEGGIFPEMMSAEVVSRLFEVFSRHVRCVILSACYSERQAAAIVKHIPYVIGMDKEIEDNAAIEFSKGFYAALGAARTIEDAFQLGVQGILQVFPGLPQHLIPVLKKKESSP